MDTGSGEAQLALTDGTGVLAGMEDEDLDLSQAAEDLEDSLAADKGAPPPQRGRYIYFHTPKALTVLNS